jgi:putative thioredoxin
MADSQYVVAVTAESFHQVVIDGSRDRLVLVDFWADWCAPCRALMPVLSSLADAYRGKLIIAKVNTEEERELAAEHGIRSLPTVQLFKDGRPVDQFMGALPEGQVRAFLERHLPRESDDLLARARALASTGDLKGASDLVAKAREADPENARIRLTEAGIAAASGNIQEAQTILDGLPMDLADDPEVTILRGQLLFAGLCADSPPESELTARLEANPADSEARYRLAARMVDRGDYEAALQQLLDLMKRDRTFEDDAARKAMLALFAMLDEEGDLVKRYRNRMSSALY